MAKFEIKVDKASDVTKVTVAGVIDEDVDFTPYGLNGSTQVEFHLGGVKAINSCGIREWIKWVSTAGTSPIKYFECPKIIVDQINMVQGFLPTQGKVMSFYVPYYSDDSGTEKNVMFTFGTEYSDQGLGQTPEVKDDSGAVMEMDVIEAKYFKFLKK